MKKILVSAVVGVAVIAAAACSSGKKASGINSGTYTVANGHLQQDQCNFGKSFYDGTNFTTVTVTKPGADGANSMDVDFGGGAETYDITGTTLHDNVNSGTGVAVCSSAAAMGTGFACNTKNPYNCSIGISDDFSGTITGTNKFTLVDTYAFTNGTTTCPAQVWTSAFGAGVTGPCTTIDTGDFHK